MNMANKETIDTDVLSSDWVRSAPRWPFCSAARASACWRSTAPPRSSPSRAPSPSTTRRCASCSWSACAMTTSRPWRSRRCSTTRRCSDASCASTAPASSTATRCSSPSISRSSSACCATRLAQLLERRGAARRRAGRLRRRRPAGAMRGFALATATASAGACALSRGRRRREFAACGARSVWISRVAVSAGLADRRCAGRARADRPRRIHLRSATADAPHGCARRTPALGVHAAARRVAAGHGAAGVGAPPARALVRRRSNPHRAHRGLSFPGALRRRLFQGPMLPRR